MAVLNTVADYVAEARILLQDLVQPYRYPDADLLTALNFAFYEIARLRPEVLTNATYTAATASRMTLAEPTPPAFTAIDSTAVPAPGGYKVPILFFIVGYAQLRDAEEVQDARASQFMNKFTSQLLTVLA